MSPPVFGDGPGVVLITSRGLRLIEMQCGLSRPRIDARQFHHDRELVELCIDYELGGATVYSDRECRSLAAGQRRWEQSFRFPVGGQLNNYGARLHHFPDLIVEQDGVRLAVELEVAEKGTPRLKEILRGYAQNGDIDQVHYLATRPVVAKRIAKLIEALGIRDTASVSPYRERSR